MVVRVKPSALKQGHWYEYVVRFALGGVATVVAGVVANIWGPAAGGLFLAFPAIFCASATLIEKHEREEKEKKGLKGEERGKNAAALDAGGAGLGSAALAGFRSGHVAACGRYGRGLAGPCDPYLVRGRGPAVAGKAQAAGRENMKAEPGLRPRRLFPDPGTKRP